MWRRAASAKTSKRRLTAALSPPVVRRPELMAADAVSLPRDSSMKVPESQTIVEADDAGTAWPRWRRGAWVRRGRPGFMAL
jgi:hypothetical protein